MEIRICQDCGENIADPNIKNCPLCGKPLVEPNNNLTPASTLTQPETENILPKEELQSNPLPTIDPIITAAEPPKEKSIGFFIAILFLSIVVILILIVKNNPPSNLNSSNTTIANENYLSTNNPSKNSNPSIGSPVIIKNTGTGLSKTITMDISNGYIGIIGAQSIDQLSSGVYRAVGPGKYTFKITDGFALITTQELAHDEWNFRIQQAYDRNQAHSNQDPGPIQFISYKLKAGKNIAPCHGYVSGDVVVNGYKRFDSNSNTFAIVEIKKGDIITANSNWLGWFSNYPKGYIKDQVKSKNPNQNEQGNVNIKWDGNW